MTEPQILITPREAAKILAVSRSTIYRWFWEGKLKGKKISRKIVRISDSSIREIMAEIS